MYAEDINPSKFEDLFVGYIIPEKYRPHQTELLHGGHQRITLAGRFHREKIYDIFATYSFR